MLSAPYIAPIGKKKYELKNHLGNVMATISDRKLYVTDHWQADVVSSSDYYPFGMTMPSRSVEFEGYRFGFNGMEKDDEWRGNGNSYDYGARVLDVRTGRWLTIDPLMMKYVELSPYNFAGNSPVMYNDPDGEVIVVANKQGQEYTLEILEKAFGKSASGFSFNEKNELQFEGDVSKLSKKEMPIFKGLQKVMNSETVTSITFEKNATTDTYGGEYTLTTYDNPTMKENTITIDPKNNFARKLGENYIPEYWKKGGLEGEKTTDPYQAKLNRDGEPIKSGTYKKTGDITHVDSRAALFFHGIGHILYPKSSEQANVIKFDNSARRIFKKKTKKGKFKDNAEMPRPLDDEHKNKPEEK